MDHMELDLRISGNLLISTLNTVRTTDGASTTLLAGSSNGEAGFANGVGTVARFNKTYVYQIDSSSVIVVDSENHCMRLLNRNDNSVTDWLGDCGSAGTTDGEGNVVRFNQPLALTKDPSSSSIAYFIDKGALSLRRLLVTENKVETILSPGEFQEPDGMIVTNELFIVFDYPNVTFINRSTDLVEEELFEGDSATDGAINSAAIGRTYSGTTLYSNVYIIGDVTNDALRLVDKGSSYVTSICSAANGEALGPINQCSIPNVISLLYDGTCVLYIGTNDGIRKLSGINASLV